MSTGKKVRADPVGDLGLKRCIPVPYLFFSRKPDIRYEEFAMFSVTLDRNAMKLPKIISTSTLAVAVSALGLVLGLATTPVMANPADENGCHVHKNPVPCEPSSGLNSELDVVLKRHGLSDDDNPVVCGGLTEEGGPIAGSGTTPKTKLSVNFVDCPPVTVGLIDPSGCLQTPPMPLALFQVSIINRKNVTSVKFWMHDTFGTQFDNGLVYETIDLPARIAAGGDGGLFEITGVSGGPIAKLVNLIKTHQQCKGEVVGAISIGKLVFSSQQ